MNNQVNDAAFTVLRSQGYSGRYPDMLRDWERVNHPDISGQRNDYFNEWLAGQGFTTGSLDDRWMEYWVSLLP